MPFLLARNLTCTIVVTYELIQCPLILLISDRVQFKLAALFVDVSVGHYRMTAANLESRILLIIYWSPSTSLILSHQMKIKRGEQRSSTVIIQ